ncbi:MAG: hypothetical protein JXB35_06285 [Anaerolineae bacterium]|nr:hypothetical protein [Anaerolineae bacterium]
MRTPDGKACPYYYVDVQRWRTGPDECRLIEGQPGTENWSSELCRQCPVPDIRRANACPNLVLHARIGRRPLRFWEKPRMQIQATCTKSKGPVADPYVGCGLCHEHLTFLVADNTHEQIEDPNA